MSEPTQNLQPTIFTEGKNAFIGVLALFLNNRAGLNYFRFNLGGLAGSFAALMISWIAFLYIPAQLGMAQGEPVMTSLLRTALSQFALYSGVALFVKLTRRDQGFVPYVIAHNWASLLLMPFQIVILFAPQGVDFFFLAAISAFSLVFFVRTTQIIFECKPGHIFMLVGILTLSMIIMLGLTGLEFWGIPPE